MVRGVNGQDTRQGRVWPGADNVAVCIPLLVDPPGCSCCDSCTELVVIDEAVSYLRSFEGQIFCGVLNVGSYLVRGVFVFG